MTIIALLVLGSTGFIAPATATQAGLADASTDVLAARVHDATAEASTFLSYTRPDEFGIHVAADVLVPMRDGFNLTCDIYRPATPDGTPAEGKFPSIVMNYTPYGRTFPDWQTDLRPFAAKGYNLIWCNTRGSQGFNGVSPAPESIAPVRPYQEREHLDNYDLIEWFAARPWSTGEVGQVGISYGGTSSMLVAGREQPPSLEAIIPIEGRPSIYDGRYPGGIYADTFAVQCGLVTGEPTCTERLSAEYAAHKTFDAYWAEQAVDPADIDVPTLYVNGFLDINISELDRVYGALGDRDDFAMILGPWVHGAPERGGPPSYNKNTISTGVYLAWFDRWLGNDRSVPKPPKVIAYEMPASGDSSDQWRGLRAWPPADATPVRFNLLPEGQLARGRNGHRGADTFVVSPDGSSGSLSYTTEPFKHSEVVTGSVKVTLTTTFSAHDGNVIVDLHDVAEDGSVTDLGPAGYLKASHRSSHSDPESVTPGTPYHLTIRVPSKYWAVQEGHRLRLTVTSKDSVVRENAPAGTVKISTGGGVSYVDLHLTKPQHH
ncbi:CocE/NonD family hydrolase (plasmid) [Nocardioides sp. R1-1]|uniref:CocE/NonD family hydrolase n=1 Tax=Nocardioides sp. R1-1 TaxID=3383502 RepID=UPI0038CFC994